MFHAGWPQDGTKNARNEAGPKMNHLLTSLIRKAIHVLPLALSLSLSLARSLVCLYRDVFMVVRDSRVWCPHDIGRDSWVWGEQETLYNIISPHEVGEEAVTDVSSLSGKNGVARG